MPAGCPGTTRRRSTADLVILRATWDYIERLDEFLAWTRAGAQPAQRAGGGGVEHRQALPGRPGRGRRADGAEPVLRAGRAGAPARRARWWSSRRSARDPLVRNGSPIPTRRASTCRDAAGRRPHRAGAALRPADRPTARRRWCSSAASSRTRSPRARSCRRRDRRRRSTSPAPTPRRSLRTGRARTSSCGTSAMRRWRPRRRTSASTSAELLYARVDVIGGASTTRGCWSWNWSSRRWAGGSSTRPPRTRQQREFALGVESALDRLGLGPLSHRRP